MIRERQADASNGQRFIHKNRFAPARLLLQQLRIYAFIRDYNLVRQFSQQHFCSISSFRKSLHLYIFTIWPALRGATQNHRKAFLRWRSVSVLRPPEHSETGLESRSAAFASLDLAGDGAARTKARSIAVLVVEDELGDFTLVERCLKRLMHFDATVLRAPTIPAARAALRIAQFDAVILDYSVQCETSLQLIGEFSAALSRIPVFLMSNAITPSIRHDAGFAGISVFFDKDDVTAPALEAALLEVLDEKRMAGSQHRQTDWLTSHSFGPSEFCSKATTLEVLRELDMSLRRLEDYQTTRDDSDHCRWNAAKASCLVHALIETSNSGKAAGLTDFVSRPTDLQDVVACSLTAWRREAHKSGAYWRVRAELLDHPLYVSAGHTSATALVLMLLRSGTGANDCVISASEKGGRAVVSLKSDSTIPHLAGVCADARKDHHSWTADRNPGFDAIGAFAAKAGCSFKARTMSSGRTELSLCFPLIERAGGFE